MAKKHKQKLKKQVSCRSNVDVSPLLSRCGCSSYDFPEIEPDRTRGCKMHRRRASLGGACSCIKKDRGD